jgi:hypothetical protein
MNRSLQTLERSTDTRAPHVLSEALEQFERAAARLGLDSGTTALVRGARVPGEGVGVT